MNCISTSCSNKVFCKGYCQKHYRRIARNGSAETVKHFKNGQSKHPLYYCYANMLKRCYGETDPHYKNYGGRGIKVSERWRGPKGFTNFVTDMGERPSGLTLDRKDNDGNYEHNNCRWATKSQQQSNRRSLRVMRIKDAYKSIEK